jgi:C4-dicarboxylate-specific signal transduction histidine kinase
MVAEIAHELNQPLYAISNFVGACRNSLDGKRNERVREGLSEISSNAARAGAIIQRLREYVRRAEPKRQMACINEIIDTTLKILEFEFRQREVDIAVDSSLDESVCQIRCDRVQIEQVVINLLRNASEAMVELPARERRIRIRLSSSENHVEIAVEDCGAGVPEEIATKIFETYFTTKKDGMGMGLSISKRIIEHHGGQIRYEPKLGQGAVFRFSLPLAIGDSSD